MRVEVLGPVRLMTGDGVEVDLGGPRQRRLLVTLLARHGRTVPLDEIIERTWDDSDRPARADRAARTYVSRLRQALGPHADLVATDSAGYRLVVERCTLDYDEFERLVWDAEEARRRGDPAEGATMAAHALHLVRGEPFGELRDIPWLRPEVERLRELATLAEEEHAESLIEAGSPETAITSLRALHAAFPLRERPVRLCALALHRCGRQAEAMRLFQQHRRRLATDLGLEPGRDLLELEARIAAADPALHRSGEPGTVRGYRIHERLGEGSFAVVYRGTQPSVARDVAIKQIRAELANRPEFIRRFEAEAHLVARLEHPHIVPLYDFWREPGSAFLVMRLLRAGSLQDALLGGPWDLARATRMATEIGGALSAAHHHGVVHRDVKPANILLDEAGHAYLTDFGIAVDPADLADPTRTRPTGSPAYASPEQLRRDPIGPAADVYGLGITLYETLTGQLPFPAGASRNALQLHQLNDPVPSIRLARADLPAGLDRVLARATATQPADRYRTVDEFVDALSALGGVSAGRSTATAIGVEDRNPYKGLRAFTEADEADFHGRTRLVDQLIELLRRPTTAGRVLAVVGPSGIGKSSVARAGLLPALRRGRVDGSAQWFVAAMVPGRDPFEELAPALLKVATQAPAHLARLLAEDPRALDRAVRSITGSGGEVLLMVDQFEELFTLTVDETVRRRFLEALHYALTDENCPFRLVLTLRADFYDRLLRHGEFAALLNDSTVPVLPLAADELERAIVDPAERVGAAFEPGLVSQIVADVADQGAALPILQYALTELFERCRSAMMTRAAYEQLGGVAGALTRRADELHDTATEAEQRAARRIFGRLVTLGDGVEDTRRRVPQAELGTDDATATVISGFASARLLTFDRDVETRQPTVEVAHEALIRQWPRLRGWLDEDRDDLRLQRQLSEAARSWKRSGDDGELYRGGRLELAEAWATTHGDDLVPEQTAFLTASTQLRLDQRAAARRQLRRLRGALSGMAVVAVVAMLAGLVALRQQSRADTEADRATLAAAEAETRRLVADAAALAPENRDVALLLASEAYRRDPGPQTLAGLQRVLSATGPYLGTIGAGGDFITARLLSDGTIIGVTETDVRFFNAETWNQESSIALPAPPSVLQGSVPVDVRDDVIAVGTEAGTVVVIDRGATRTLTVSDSGLRAIALGPGVLAAGGTDGVVHLIDLATGQKRWATPVGVERTYRQALGDQRWEALPEGVKSFYLTWEDTILGSGPSHLKFNQQGALVVAVGVRLRALDASNGAVLHDTQLLDPSGSPRAAAHFTEAADGSYWAVSSNASQHLDATFEPIASAFVPTGRRDLNVIAHAIATDTSGQVWFGLNNGQLARGLAGSPLDVGLNPATGLSDIHDLEPDPSGGTLLAAGAGGIVVWATDGRQLLAQAAPRDGNSGATLSTDGATLITSTLNGAIPTGIFDLSADPPTRRDTSTLHLDRSYATFDPLDRFMDEFDNGTSSISPPSYHACTSSVE